MNKINKRYHHETLARGADAMRTLADAKITICGAGALGANLAWTLARTGCQRLTLIDMDRVEEHNLSTQPWARGDIGQLKAKLLAVQLYRALGVEATAHAVQLTADNAARLLDGAQVVIDVFDNSPSRATVQTTCAALGIPCLHAGMADGYAEVIWDPGYRVPSAAHDDVCDYPLARNLITLTVSVTAEALIRHLTTDARRAYTITLDDLSIQALDL